MIFIKKNAVACALITVLSFCFFKGQAQHREIENKKHFEINGLIKGLNSTNVYLLFSLGTNNIDTLTAKSMGDHFKFTGEIGKTSRAYIVIGEPRSRRQIYFYLEPGKIQITGNVDSLNSALVTGTLANNELTKANSYLEPIYNRRAALSQKLITLNDQSPEAAKLQQEFSKKTDSANAYMLHFMETHPGSEVSYSYLYVLQDRLPTATVERIFNSFPDKWRNSPDGKNIYAKLTATKSVAIGNKAPDFTSTTPDGSKIKLSDLKGKYVLLEFWAQWCVPCRAQHPHLKEVYHKYKERGFTILQYSVDVKKDEQKWKAAIKHDELVWPQACDLYDGKAPVAALYGVQPIPDSFLISPDGIILGRRLNPKELDEKLAKLLK